MICSILQLPHAIPIGVQTESGVESIGFDVKPWLDAHKDLTLSVWPTRPGEDDAYQAADVELVDNVLYWRPNGADTAIMGVGKVEILGLTGDKRKLSGWCETIVRGTSLYTTKETPDAMKVWVDEVILAGANAVAATKKMPKISDHGTWMMWDEAAGDYVDTGKPSQGETGPKGDRGPEGDQGHAATVTVGSVTTLPAGSYATVKNSGTDIAVVLDFGIPRGADGAGGSGSGEAGEDGGFYVPEVNDGIISWSPSKADMPPVSAADIRGPQGPAGERGPEGPQGSQGVAGPQGIPGDTRVYVGSDEPPEDAEVWIDPEGAVSGSDLPAATETGRGAVILDTSLTKPGAAADAKAVGDKFTALTEEIETIKETIGTTEMEWVDVGNVTPGGFINGASASPFYTIINTPDYAYAVAVVDHSRKYRVTCSAPVGPRMIAMFRDANGVKIGDVKHPTTDQQIVYYENLKIEVPSSAYDIVVTSYVGGNTGFVACLPKIEELREVGENDENTLADYEIEQLTRRITQAEKANDFAWGTFDKAYFVFVHDDTNSFLSTAYNAFHAENAPLSAATVASMIKSTYDGKTAKEWLDLIVADGGEVLMHYNADLKNDSADDLWRTHVVEPKRVLESEGFEVRGLILANSSDVNSAKGEKFCRRYYDYADKVGTSTRYKLGRTLMLSFASLDAFKAHLDTCAQTPGLYAFGFHGLRTDEAWITEASLREIIQYIKAKSSTEITTYGAVFDAIGTTVLEKRIAALESAN